MNQDEKRQLENVLTVMGLPGLDHPDLVQQMAELVNRFPVQGERVEFFCELLNECEGARRREMYEAMRPRLTFDVPSLDACEAKMAERAERQIRPRGLPVLATEEERCEVQVTMQCGGCARSALFVGYTLADARSEGHKAGWGRGPIEGKSFCPECRLAAMPVKAFGRMVSRLEAVQVGE